MATFIQLTHNFNNQSTPVYVNVDQICRVGESVGGGPGYPTNILLAQGQIDVKESVAAVMQLIKPAAALATARTPAAARARRRAK
jgi:hypothetical protein